tara:strand:- start:96 stop:440 length:345 start_codon:yes stop_codon:yes gene_type:complete
MTQKTNKKSDDILEMIRSRQDNKQLTPQQTWGKIIHSDELQEELRQNRMVTEYELDYYTREQVIEAALQLGVRIGQDYDPKQADCVIAENLSKKIEQVGRFLQQRHGTKEDNNV